MIYIKKLTFCLVSVVVVGLLTASCRVDPGNDKIGTVSRIEGSGPVRINGKQVYVGASFYSGDTLTTGNNAWATLSLNNGGEIRFDQNTDPSVLLQWLSSGICRIRMFIDIGRVFVDTECQLSAETGSGAVVETLGTRVNIKVTRKETALTVLNGKATLRSTIGEPRLVEAGYKSILKRGQHALQPKKINLQRTIDWSLRLGHLQVYRPSIIPVQREVSVPHLVGKRFQESEKILHASDLRFGKITHHKSQNRSLDGQIKSQRPKAGSIVKPNAGIDVTVYRLETEPIPEKHIPVPRVTGRSLSDAEYILQKNGLRLGRIRYEATQRSKQADQVFEQNPRPGERVLPNSPVDLGIYRSREPTEPTHHTVVPKVTGMHVEKAMAILKRHGFQTGRVNHEDTGDRDLDRRVVRQTPSAGAAVEPGMSVGLTIYSFKAREPQVLHIMMPRLTGMHFDKAEKIIGDYRLSLKDISHSLTNNRSYHGWVKDQFPRPGEQVTAGTAVRLTVYEYRHREPSGRKAVVPEVIGKRVEEAENIIRESGLVRGEIVLKTTRSRRESGLIFRQDPPPGNRVKSGTRLNIWAYEYLGPPSMLRRQP